jgi:mono/diheme cytochrome c family protein
MRGTATSGLLLLIGALLVAVVLVVGLYAWDSGARAAEAALRPAPVAPLAPVAQTPSLPLVTSSPPALAQTSPGPAPAGDPAAGQRVFASNCNSCHPNANAGIGPALYGPQFTARFADDAAVVAVIRHGKGGMPAFASSQLSDQDVANVISYLRGLGTGAIAPEPTPTPRPRQRSG